MRVYDDQARYQAAKGSPGAVKSITLDQLVERLAQSVDLLLMDVQGLEVEVLRSGAQSLDDGLIETILMGTHSQALHRECLAMLAGHRFDVEYELYETKLQPDGIIAASLSPALGTSACQPPESSSNRFGR